MVSIATPLARFDGRPLTFHDAQHRPGVPVEGWKWPAGWERRLGMKAKELTAETLPKALRIMRLSAELTQAELSKRTARLGPPLKSLNSQQISAFERGAKRPTSVNLFSVLVGCSPDGATLDLGLLQVAWRRRSPRRRASRPWRE